MQHLWRNILRGLIAVVPVLATLYLVVWLAVSAEWLLGLAVKRVLPAEWYWPGFGLVLSLVLLYGIGRLVDHWVVRHGIGAAEGILARIPLVSKVFHAVQDVITYFTRDRTRNFNQVVCVDLLERGISVIGLVTREDLAELPDGLESSTKVAVYIPGSYQIGGFTFHIDRALLTPVDMSVEDALRYAVTGGMSYGRRVPNGREPSSAGARRESG